ncbi:hypothetical protein CAP35_06470 [Chitinophagaceae bacterium IBVUCB1]|nr:hypothetical protein CAP35_06470 [Chitinophagaceae bacterium IBVUCB1]
MNKQYKKFQKVVKLSNLKRHPFHAETYQLNEIEKLADNIKRNGLVLKEITADEHGNILSGARVIEAMKRLGWTEITITVFQEITEEDAREIIISSNLQRVKTVYETTKEAEYYLSVLPKQQGKRTDIKPDAAEAVPEWARGMERYEAIADKIGADMSGATLRKLMEVKRFEETQPDANLGLLEKINSRDLSIDRAAKIIKNYEEQQCELSQIKPITPVPINDDGAKDWTLYHSSSQNMKELLDGVIQTCITSVPYFSVRKYGKGKQTKPELGLESTYQEYINNMIPFFKEIYRVLSVKGSFFLNIGETYSCKSNNNIMLRLVLAACDEAGFHLVNSIVWHKTNVLPQATDKRLQPSYEMIYHLVKDAEQYDYYPLKYVDGTKKSKLYSIDRHNNRGGLDIGEPALSKPYKKFKDFIDSQEFEDVITSNSAAIDSAELKKIEPNIRHNAIFPNVICVLPILTTSLPGQLVLDAFSGSGTCMETALMLGRKAVGYEIEERFVHLTHKRLEGIKDKVNEADIAVIQQEVEDTKVHNITYFAKKDAQSDAA